MHACGMQCIMPPPASLGPTAGPALLPAAASACSHFPSLAEPAQIAAAAPLPICLCAVAIMHSLRQSLVDAGGSFAEPHPGWQPGDPAPPCHWQNVQCNSDGSITDL
jgi:hypothetical protein